MTGMDIRIIVAAHKEYRMPDEHMYLPLQVGAARKGTPELGMTGDNTGDNISLKNKNYCELTGLYWAWKNLDAEYIGLCHYRRYFRGCRNRDRWNCLLTKEQAEAALGKAPVLLPKKRNYFIETNYSQYAHAHHSIDLDTTRQIIAEKYAAYIPAYDSLMKKTCGHRFNMLVMRRDILDGYMSWLFDILEELERRLDISAYSENDSRVFGFVSERLLDVWIETNRISYTELPVVNMEDQHWLKKGSAFLKRKLNGGKKNA